MRQAFKSPESVFLLRATQQHREQMYWFTYPPFPPLLLLPLPYPLIPLVPGQGTGMGHLPDTEPTEAK